MTAKQLKNKLNKKTPLLMSPFGFALAACGGGGGDEDNELILITPKLSNVLTLAPSGDEIIDMMTTGSYYRSSATSPIFYGLTDGHYGEQWENPEAVAAVLQDVMAEFGQYADINLQYAGKYDSPNAATSAGVSVVLTFDKFVFDARGEDSTWWRFHPDATDDDDAGIDQIGGDMYLNFNAPVFNASSQAVFESRITDTDFGYAVLMHGMLGTVGVKATYSESDGHPSIENTNWADDADDYTISASNISYDSIAGDFGATLGILDIFALMHLYGPNPSTNVGDTEYHLSDITEYTVIYDAGGEDTISFEGTDRDLDIGMPNLSISEVFSAVGDLKLGTFFVSWDSPQQVIGFIIGDLENIKTGSGNDNIITNTLDNVVHAGAGDDTIQLSAGNDVIYGGAGADIFNTESVVFGSNHVGTNTIIKDFEIGIDILDLPHSPDEDVYSRNEDGYATYTTSSGVNVVLEGVEANILLLQGDFTYSDTIADIEAAAAVVAAEAAAAVANLPQLKFWEQSTPQTPDDYDWATLDRANDIFVLHIEESNDYGWFDQAVEDLTQDSSDAKFAILFTNENLEDVGNGVGSNFSDYDWVAADEMTVVNNAGFRQYIQVKDNTLDQVVINNNYEYVSFAITTGDVWIAEDFLIADMTVA